MIINLHLIENQSLYSREKKTR